MIKVYLVVLTEWEEYRESWVFSEKFEAEKFIRHYVIEDQKSDKLSLEEKDVIK